MTIGGGEHRRAKPHWLMPLSIILAVVVNACSDDDISNVQELPPATVLALVELTIRDIAGTAETSTVQVLTNFGGDSIIFDVPRSSFLLVPSPAAIFVTGTIGLRDAQLPLAGLTFVPVATGATIPGTPFLQALRPDGTPARVDVDQAFEPNGRMQLEPDGTLTLSDPAS